MSNPRILLKVLRNPEMVGTLSYLAWEALLASSQHARLTASLSYRIEDKGLKGEVPQKVWTHFEASRVFADFRNRQILWELNRVQRALRQVDFEVIALKGGAYLLLDLPLARGRLPADLDILVRKENLPAMEKLLLDEGWQPTKLDDYDQRYYREWMHEIPPLRHPERQVEVDVHHALLPMTARIHASPELLWSSARPVEGSRFRVMGPEDLTLHAIVHLFYDSDFDNRLRDLLDIDELLRFHASQDETFWSRLIQRAEDHGLTRPLAYALHICSRILDTPVPEHLRLAGTIHPWLLKWMELLICRALLPQTGHHFAPIDATARWLLYVRSHYLRMPLRLLLPHLARKAWKGS